MKHPANSIAPEISRPAVAASFWLCASVGTVFLVLNAPPAAAQRAGENAVASATDAFGSSVGDERIGLYSEDNTRGFSPITAGNRRLEGMYIDLQGTGLTQRLTSQSAIRVGLTAMGYPFPAPSGIVDYRLRPVGKEFVTSVVMGIPAYGGHYIDADAQIPLLGDQLSLAAGAGYTANEYQDGRTSEGVTAALIPRLKFDRGSLTAFWTYNQIHGAALPVMVTAGPYLPRQFDPGHFAGQSWADRLQRTHTYGMLGQIDLNEHWSLSAGAFESQSTRYRSFIDLFVDVMPDGSARNLMIAEPALPARWTSAEARLTWTHTGESSAHQVHLAARGRDKELEVGGGSSVLLGPARIGVPNPAAEPEFVFQPTTENSVNQWALGFAYLGKWRWAEVNAGLQTTDYRQTISRADMSDSTDAQELLYSTSVAILPRPWLAFYVGQTVGLEETPAPPASAANRDASPPASRTRQKDAGVRLSFGTTRIVAGVFETQRPYFATDAANLYTGLGERRNRGTELSIVTQPLRNLRVVAGAVYSDAEVTGEAVELGRTGPEPLGSNPLYARLDLDYSIDAIPGLSTQLSVVRTGDTIASTKVYSELGARQLEIPAATTFDLGVRYRWTMGSVPFSARLMLQNLTDERLLRSAGSNSFTLNGSRRASLQVSMDL